MDSKDLFEWEFELPSEYLQKASQRLVGYQELYNRIWKHLQILLDPGDLKMWSKEFHKQELPLLDVLVDRYPLVIFHGDVGTGKTAMAETISDGLCRELGKESRLFKLSTRVRGHGLVGQMSHLINMAFDIVMKDAGKSRYSFLILDEADSLAATRTMKQSHQEDKVGVNTLIQKIDQIRELNGRVLIFLCTNRILAVDPAILRRAALIEHFGRPNDNLRCILFKQCFDGLSLSTEQISQLVQATGPSHDSPGFTYSDVTTRLIPNAIIRAYPNRALTFEDLIETAKEMTPTASVEEEYGVSP